jgi:hypothetical protein
MPQDPIEGSKHFARFTLPNGETLDGEFLLDGPQTYVSLYTDRYPSDPSGDFSTLQADLPAGQWLSFLKCVRMGGETSRSGADRQQAVNCRNHYVHGTSSKIDYRGHFFETVPFFTESLEFVFAASDFIEAGWSITDWLKQGTTLSHPFGTYCSYYKHNLDALKVLLNTTREVLDSPG